MTVNKNQPEAPFDPAFALLELSGEFAPRSALLREIWKDLTHEDLSARRLNKLVKRVSGHFDVPTKMPEDLQDVPHQLRSLRGFAGKPFPLHYDQIDPWSGVTRPDNRWPRDMDLRIERLTTEGSRVNRFLRMGSSNFEAGLSFGADLSLVVFSIWTPVGSTDDHISLRGNYRFGTLLEDELRAQMPDFFADCTEIARSLNS